MSQEVIDYEIYDNRENKKAQLVNGNPSEQVPRTKNFDSHMLKKEDLPQKLSIHTT